MTCAPNTRRDGARPRGRAPDGGPGDHGDHGFTLVELIVSIVVVSLLSVASLAAISTVLRTAPSNTKIVSESVGEQQVVNYFYPDVRSTPPDSWTASPTAGGCSGTDPGINVVQLTWRDGPQTNRASYRVSTSNGTSSISRYRCNGTSPTTLGPASVRTILAGIDPVPAQWAGGTAPAYVTSTGNVMTLNLTQSAVHRTLTVSSTLRSDLGTLPTPVSTTTTVPTTTTTPATTAPATTAPATTAPSTTAPATTAPATTAPSTTAPSTTAPSTTAPATTAPATTAPSTTAPATTAPATTAPATTAPSTTVPGTTTTTTTTVPATTTTTPSGVALNPVAAGQGFMVITEGDASIKVNSLQGAAAVGGNLSWGNFETIASAGASTYTFPSESSPAGLIIGGYPDFANSSGGQLTVGSGFAHAGSLGSGALLSFGTNIHIVPGGTTNNYATPRVIVSADQSNQTANPVMRTAPYPFASSFTTFRNSTIRIAALNPTACTAIAYPALSQQFGSWTLTLVTGKVNILNVSVADLNAMSNLNSPSNPDATTKLIINVTDYGTITPPTRYWGPLQNGQKTSIMWNYPNATNITLTSAVYGTVFAPNATITTNGMQLSGDLIAKSAAMTNGDVSLAHFDTAVPCIG
jgi:choice-of-anchor A domain-containing protein/prepilin-type N-terminal cleavage/methylation domain-containing protein